MLPFKTLLNIDKNSPEAVFKQIASQLVLLIQKGILLPDMQLPSTRLLAADLGLHRKTIMAAYNTLIAEDWLISKERKEYRVSTLLPIIKPRTYASKSKSSYKAESAIIYDKLEHLPSFPKIAAGFKVIVDDGFPDVNIFPVERVSQEYRRLLTHQTLKKSTATWNIDGSPVIKEALSSFLNDTRGLNIEQGNLMITRGAQMAIYLAASLIIKAGDKVLVTSPNFFLADAVFMQLGAQLITVPVDDEGADVDAIADALEKNNIKLLYIIPHHHHPTTVTLSSTRRAKLLELIRIHQLAVIEDDYDYDFQYQYSPYLPLASGAHDGNVIYIGSLTKVLGSNFRLGYMISTPNFLHSAVKLKMLIDIRGDALMEGTIASLMENGEFSRFIMKANKLYEYRCDSASNLINSELNHLVEFKKPQGGMALWLKFKENYQVANIVNKASSLGLQLIGMPYFKSSDLTHDAIRFGFASLNEKELEFAVDVLKKITFAK
ncbi:PLP-dependent aminotransferase family protein [Mucilaginibacter sabulilitoris]|uniref:PLP-dependent aminotransferase family protein n=1 Tax=Mucilaginibacter sabulilitoris TaxID=1173583 RepID=A0ABZ0TKD5_9SPHI|nr:PLP-dependent aminotransferase family protein [Mucilaginibacter sabulilitoris]WPU93156.1 PLP-dependent aminotransferase family protein [Mucilaginibacter sabulilitoris]